MPEVPHHATQASPWGPVATESVCRYSRPERVLDAVASRFSRHSGGAAGLWLLLVAASMTGFSSQKLLWNDEVLTRWIVVLPTAREILGALKLGTSLDPPPTVLLTHALTRVFGDGSLILRLPSMAGVCAMLAFLFLTLRRHVRAEYALLALMLPYCTILPDYGYEGRPYGLLYGCLAAAIYCWDRSRDGDHEKLWNIAFSAALVAALGCHYFAVFALPAFCLGEVVRSIERRRINWMTWAAIGIPSIAELCYLPIMVSLHHQFSGAYFAGPHLESVPQSLAASLNGFALPLFIFLLLAGACIVANLRLAPDTRGENSGHFRELAALALGFLLVPVIGWIAGLVVLKAFVDRYVLHGLLGLFLLAPMLVSRLFRSNRLLVIPLGAALAIPALTTVFRGVTDNFQAPAQHLDYALLAQALQKVPGDIVVTNPLLFDELVDYSPFLRAKCVYLIDRDNEQKYTGQHQISVNLPNWARIHPIRTMPWAGFPQRNGAFLFLVVRDPAGDGPVDWLRPYLRSSNRYGDVIVEAGRYIVVRAKPVNQL